MGWPASWQVCLHLPYHQRSTGITKANHHKPTLLQGFLVQGSSPGLCSKLSHLPGPMTFEAGSSTDLDLTKWASSPRGSSFLHHHHNCYFYINSGDSPRLTCLARHTLPWLRHLPILCMSFTLPTSIGFSIRITCAPKWKTWLSAI